MAFVTNPANYFRRLGGRQVTFATPRAPLGVLLPESAGREARDTSVCARQLDEILRQKDKTEVDRSILSRASARFRHRIHIYIYIYIIGLEASDFLLRFCATLGTAACAPIRGEDGFDDQQRAHAVVRQEADADTDGGPGRCR